MSPGTDAVSPLLVVVSRLGALSKLLSVGLVCVAFGAGTSGAAARSFSGALAEGGASCATQLVPAQAGGDEERGCCVFITDSGPRCTYTSRGYCMMRAAEAGLRFEFHTVASCSDLPQCR